MKISAINSFNSNYYVKSFKSTKINSNDSSMDLNYLGVSDEVLRMRGSASKYFKMVDNVSNKKVGSKFILESALPEYKGLRLLITPDTVIESRDKNNPFKISIEKLNANSTSFKGRLYGSIRQDDDGKVDYKMQDEYIRFWTDGMLDEVTGKISANYYANDYNFFIPSDGDGTRYKDITSLQGEVTKPASYIPATLNNKQMSLIQGVISNFAQTSKLDKGFEFVRVKPAQGSAYAFLEGLKSGQISADKPIVFSWGDNFSDINVSRIMHNHEKSGAVLSMLVIPVDKQNTKSLSIIKPSETIDKKIDDFVEKPLDDDFIESCAVIHNGEKKYLSAVGPYILSKEVLHWIKDKYTENPAAFKSKDKGYDFSSMIIYPVLMACKNGEFDKDGQKGFVMYDLIDDSETWSDLGSQKDFSKAMMDIKNSDRRINYIGFPSEMRQSLSENIDDNNNITFNTKSKRMFNKMLSSLNLEAHNVIAYCKDYNLIYN